MKKLHWTDSQFDRTSFLLIYTSTKPKVNYSVIENIYVVDNFNTNCIAGSLIFLSSVLFIIFRQKSIHIMSDDKRQLTVSDYNAETADEIMQQSRDMTQDRRRVTKLLRLRIPSCLQRRPGCLAASLSISQEHRM